MTQTQCQPEIQTIGSPKHENRRSPLRVSNLRRFCFFGSMVTDLLASPYVKPRRSQNYSCRDTPKPDHGVGCTNTAPAPSDPHAATHGRARSALGRIGAVGRGARARAGWRNGYEPKGVQTEAGLLEFAVPQLRATAEPFRPKLVDRLASRTPDLEACWCAGCMSADSRRKMSVRCTARRSARRG